MKTTTKTDAQLIATFRTAAARRRSKSVLNSQPSGAVEGVSNSAGVVTVTSPLGGKPVSELGGPTKVFGRSRISIPEFKLSHR